MNAHVPAVTRRTLLGLVGTGAATAAFTATGLPASAASGQAVVLTDHGDTVTLENGVVSATFIKSTAVTSALHLVGSEHGNGDVNLFSGTNGRGYSEFDYYVGTTKYRTAMTGATYEVVQQSADRVEIAMTVADPTVLPFVVELHAVLERGLSGLYYYMVYRYTEVMPDALNIAQLRYAFAAGDPSFTHFVVDDDRGVQQRPTIAQMAAVTTLQDTTYVLPDGTLYSKYQNISNLEGDNDVFLISNGSLGLSVVQPSKEYFNGGPTKQELTCHDFYDGEILLWHPMTSHYGSSALLPEKGWEKIYGPFLLHVTESDRADPAAAVAAMWKETKKVARREGKRWPYTWVTDPLYAADDRGDVTGTLRITDGSDPGGARVVLAEPGTDWQLQNQKYVYWATADDHGRFTVEHVRPGTYTLSAYVAGVLGEHTVEQVTVTDRHLHLGTLDWTPRSHGTTLWQLGTPDRSTSGFHVHGGPDGHRATMTWLEYPYEFPQGVDFTIGVSDPATDWNYFHPCYRTPGTDLQLAWRGTTADRSLETWRVRFALDEAPTGTATLDVALAGAVFGSLRFVLNGTEVGSVDPLPGVPGDNCSYRLASRAMYRLLDPVQFDAALLTAGENVLELTPVHAPVAPTSDNWMAPMGGVMYDTIRLQVDAG